jgi:hypothetical protein
VLLCVAGNNVGRHALQLTAQWLRAADTQLAVLFTCDTLLMVGLLLMGCS